MKPEDIVQSDVQCNENRGRSITLRQTTSVSFVLKKHIDIAFDDTIFELADRAFNLSKVRCGVNSNVVQEIYVTANNEGWDAKTTRISYQLNAKLVTDRFTGNRYNLVILDGKYVDSRLAYFKEESERALKQYRKQKQLEEQRKRQQQEAIVRKRLEENRKHYNSLRSARIGRNVHTIKEFKDLAKGNQAKFERETIGKEMGLLGRVLEIKNSSPEIAKKYGARDLVWVVLTHGEPMEELLARTRGMSQYHRQSTINSETNMSDKMFMYGVGAACAAVDSKNINRALELRKADLVQAYGTIAEIDRVDKPLIKPCEIRLLERAQQR